MLERSFVLELQTIEKVIKWTLMSKHGRVVTIGAATSERNAHRLASKHLPWRGRITETRWIT